MTADHSPWRRTNARFGSSNVPKIPDDRAVVRDPGSRCDRETERVVQQPDVAVREDERVNWRRGAELVEEPPDDAPSGVDVLDHHADVACRSRSVHLSSRLHTGIQGAVERNPPTPRRVGTFVARSGGMNPSATTRHNRWSER